MHIGDLDEVEDNLFNHFTRKIHFRLPEFLNKYKKYPGFKEKLSVVKNKSKLAYSISYKTTDINNVNREVYRTKIIEWDPTSLMAGAITDYDILQEMKESLLVLEDFEHLNDNLSLFDMNCRIDRHTDIFKKSMADFNKKLTKDLISFAAKHNLKFRLDARSKGILDKSEDDDSNNNLLNEYIKKGNRKFCEKIIKILGEDLVEISDITDTIILCKESLFEKYDDIYVALLKNMSTKTANYDFYISKNNGRNLYEITDSTDAPNWYMNSNLRSTEKVLKDAFENIENKDLNQIKNINMLREILIWNERMKGYPDSKENEVNRSLSKFEANYITGNKSTSIVIPWKKAVKIGEDGLLNEIIHKRIWDALDSEDIQDLIDYKWEKFARNSLIVDGIIHIVLTLTFTAFSTFRNFKRYNNIKRFTIVQLSLYKIAFILSIYNFAREIIQLSWIRYYYKKEMQEKSNTLKFNCGLFMKWANTMWNLIEFIMYGLISFVIPIIDLLEFFYDYNTSTFLILSCSLAVWLLWWKMLYYLINDQRISILIGAMFNILYDIIAFIVVIFIIVLGFTSAFYIIFSYDVEESMLNDKLYIPFATYPRSMISTFGMMFGDFDIDWFLTPKLYMVTTIGMVIYLVIVTIGMFNLVIAIMGDLYDQIKPKQNLIYYKNRCKIIYDVETKMTPSRQKQLK